MECNKRILIISPNLEPGYCGVSDYVFVLKSFFEEEGHNCSLLALSDKYCDKIISQPNTLRIPFSTKDHNKIILANEFIILYKPDIVYFNLVSYGYSKKGFPFYLLKILPEISRKHKTVLIAHELWVGNFKSESFKFKLIGFLQKQLFTRILALSNIKKIFVTTSISKNILNTSSIKSTVCAVFSNIPIYKIVKSIISNKTVSFVLFGSISFPIDIKESVSFFKERFINNNIHIIIYTVGLCRGYVEDWSLVKNELSKYSVEFRDIGFADTKIISTIMQECNFGLTSYMPEFWSKSGSIAAFLAHGLPVISMATKLEKSKLTNASYLHPNIYSLSQLINLIPEYHERNKLDFEYNKAIFLKMNLV